MEVKDSGCETCDSGCCLPPKSGKCLQNRNRHIPVLLNLGGSCTTVLLRSFNMIIFSYRYYDKKYQVFLKLVEHQKEYAAIMKGD